MRSVTAYSTPRAGAPFERTTIERRDLGSYDVLVKIAFAGICHSDIHTGRAEWGTAIFPLVPGHEMTGVVEEVGAAVTRYRPGDNVGVGVIVDSCRECENCLAGEEQYCLRGTIETYNSIGRDGRPTYGGYSTHIVVDENYVLRVPEGIGLDIAAPLLCAGITVYSPLKYWNVGPGKEIAIVGLGGLGHVGVKIAHALGAEVTVLSQSLAKQPDAVRFGADHFFATGGADLDQLARRFDLILNTVSVPLPIDSYLSMLRTNGTMINVGAPPGDLALKAFSLIGQRRSFSGSMIGGMSETQEMLDFCAVNGLGAEIELISSEQIDEAWNRVVASDVRYRFVIDAATF